MPTDAVDDLFKSRREKMVEVPALSRHGKVVGTKHRVVDEPRPRRGGYNPEAAQRSGPDTGQKSFHVSDGKAVYASDEKTKSDIRGKPRK